MPIYHAGRKNNYILPQLCSGRKVVQLCSFYSAQQGPLSRGEYRHNVPKQCDEKCLAILPEMLGNTLEKKTLKVRRHTVGNSKIGIKKHGKIIAKIVSKPCYKSFQEFCKNTFFVLQLFYYK